jgi:hypothetical protein
VSWIVNPFRFGAPPGGRHRYWEILAIHPQGDTTVMRIAEIALAATVGGTNIASGKTVAAIDLSGRGSGFSNPSRITDGSTANSAELTAGNRHWGYGFRIDLGAPEDVAEVRITNDTTQHTQSLSTFWVRGSDDATNWTTYLIHRKEMWPASQTTKSFPLGVAYPTTGRSNAIAWRMRITANNGAGDTNLDELEWRATVGGARLNTLTAAGPGGADPTSGIPYNSYHAGLSYPLNCPENSADADNATRWVGGVTAPVVIGWIFPAPQGIGQIRVRSALFASPSPQAWEIEYSTDFNTWTSVLSVSGQTGWGATPDRTFTVP